jgi:hypothetical protein
MLYDRRMNYEYRWLVHNSENKPEYVSIIGSISAVFVGDNFPKENEQSLIELCKELGIPIGKITWLNGIPIAQRASIYDPI